MSFFDDNQVDHKKSTLIRSMMTLHQAQEKYQDLVVFFNILSSMEKPKESNNDNRRNWQIYCQQAKLHMVRYFNQCVASSSFNEQRSIQVHQAASLAAATHFQYLMERDILPKLNLPPIEGFTYRERQIYFNKLIRKQECTVPKSIKHG